MAGEAKRMEFALHQTRLLASILLQPHAKKGQRIRPSDLFELPSDRDAKQLTRRMTSEQVASDIKMKLQAYGKHS